MKLDRELTDAVAISLAEDVGTGDITAELIPAETAATATVITREETVIAGQPWFSEVFRQLDPAVSVYWLIGEGELALANQPLVKLSGSARSLLTGERCALNWLQTLSAVATRTHQFVQALQGTNTQLLDTRKTLPGLRYAEKYAVKIGGGHNHRMGLFDAYLIKENHIVSAGSITKAIEMARKLRPEKSIEVEVENLAQLKEALKARADIIMLDNFSLADMQKAVKQNAGQAKLEVSGSVNLSNIKSIAATGVDFISVGALTKHIQAVDLSMRFKELDPRSRLRRLRG